MGEHTALFERAAARYGEPQFSKDGLLLRRERKQRNQRVAAGVLGIAVFALAAIGLVRLLGSEGTPASDTRSPFEGTWVSTSDPDGGTQTMTVRVSAEGAVGIVVLDDVATVCSGTPSTMTGTGRIEAGTALVIPAPVYTCDDGSEPEALSGPPLQEQLRDWTLVLDPQTDTLSDGFGGLWLRPGAESPSPAPTASGGMWPQTTLEEVRQAQELADEGDPAYAWQVDPTLAAGGNWEAEIFDRFLREELGWEAFDFDLYGPGLYEWKPPATWSGVVFVRCASGETNPLYPNDPEACAPTIDGLRYETVSIDAAQLDRRGPTGIWVVTRWQMLPPFEQVTPPSDAEIAEVLNGFLEARVAGEGAERYVMTDPSAAVPLLYETTAGAPYTRGEFEVVRGPEWPYANMELEVRLFAGETVVEQRFLLNPCYQPSARGCVTANEGLTIFGPITWDGGPGTTENGEAVAPAYSIVDGEVTFAATNPPWGLAADLGSTRTLATLRADFADFGGIKVLADPLPVGTGCETDAAPADAQAWAERILSDPDMEATEPTPIRIAGVEALQMDVAPAAGASICDSGGEPVLFTSADDPLVGTALWRSQVGLWDRYSYRVYLLDVPAGSSRILAVVVFAFDRDFDEVVEAAAPVLDSFEFQAR